MTTRQWGRVDRVRRGTTGALALGLVLTLAACSGGEEAAPAPDPTAVTQPPSPEPTPETEVETATVAPDTEVETATAEPAESRPLSGGPVLAVKIDQVDPAYPRTGIASADVIYVDEVEYGLTRLMAVFSSTLPEVVGPVRSARPNDPTILANYGDGVPLAFAGSSRQTNAYLERGTQINVADGPGFYRDNSRAAPHNLYADPEVLLESGGGSQPPEDIGFRFGEPAPGGEPATSVATSYPAARMSAVYDEDSGTFEISTNGRVEIDTITGEPVAPTTVVLQKVRMAASDNVTPSGHATPLSELVGQGEVLVLRDGKVWEGQWSREADDAPTEFTVDGEELTFAPGQVWLWFVKPDQRIDLE